MKKILFLLLICVACLGGGLFYTASVLSPYRVDVETSWTAVHEAAAARAKSVPELCRELKAFSSKEADIRKEAEEAAVTVISAENMKQMAEPNETLSADIGRLLLAAENYSYLTSREDFKNLTIELEAAENRLAVTRAAYNRAADAYNAELRKFPISAFAGILGDEPAQRMGRIQK